MSVLEAVDLAIAAGDPWIPEQVDDELRPFVAAVLALRPRHVIEIGVRRGGTSAIWHACCAGLVVGIDLPTDWNRDRHAQLAAALPRFRSLLCDSHDPDAPGFVAALLGGEPADLLFVDGDHSYDGVRQDYAAFAPLVRPGGIVAFHDVTAAPGHFETWEHGGTPRFWRELDMFGKTLLSAGADFGGIGMVTL